MKEYLEKVISNSTPVEDKLKQKYKQLENLLYEIEELEEERDANKKAWKEAKEKIECSPKTFNDLKYGDIMYMMTLWPSREPFYPDVVEEKFRRIKNDSINFVRGGYYNLDNIIEGSLNETYLVTTYEDWIYIISTRLDTLNSLIDKYSKDGNKKI